MVFSGSPGAGRVTPGGRWRILPPDERAAAELARALGISPVTAQILLNRGIDTPEAAREFLNPGFEGLHDPFIMKGMKEAVDAVIEALGRGEKLWIYGDYDVDGITSTSLLVRLFRSLGASVEYYIPSRFDEGYGLHRPALDEAAARGIGTIITVDCGITAVDEVEYGKSLGLRLIITDHHEPHEKVPDAAAVVNPKRADCPYPFKGLSGVGVAFKLGQALVRALASTPREELLWNSLDLVALGTIADLVPLVGENRIIVREGLRLIAASDKPGIRALLEVAGLARPGVNETGVGFGLAPRLNAIGRLGEALAGVELLTTEDEAEALELARRLDGQNRQRQAIEAEILDEALALVAAEVDLARDRVIVLAAEGWHHGVVGIVASRIVDRFYRPTVLIAIEGDEGKGSARSIPGFNLFQALSECDDILERYGGHAQAAGLTMKVEDIPALRHRLNRAAERALSEEDLLPQSDIDALVDLDLVTGKLVSELAALAPHGFRNPPPLLAAGPVSVVNCRVVGKTGSHLKLTVRKPDQGPSLDGIAFGMGDRGSAMRGSSTAGLAFVPEFNEWNGERRLQLIVKDILEGPDLPWAAAASPKPAGRAGENLRLTRRAIALLLRDSAPLKDAAWSQGATWEPWKDGSSHEEEPAVPPDISVIDRRRSDDPLAGVAQVVSEPGRALVFCRDPRAAANLAGALGERFPEAGAETLFYHGNLPEDLKREILSRFGNGGAKALALAYGGTAGLSAGVAGFSPGVADRVVLYGPPYTAAQLRCAAALCRAGGTLMPAFNDAELRTAWAALQVHCPDREDLARVYLAMKGLAGFGQDIEVNTFLSIRRVRAATVKASLEILAELGLARWSESRGVFALLPAQGKMDLESSDGFRRRIKFKQEFRAFGRYLLEVTAEKMSSDLTEAHE